MDVLSYSGYILRVQNFVKQGKQEIRSAIDIYKTQTLHLQKSCCVAQNFKTWEIKKTVDFTFQDAKRLQSSQEPVQDFSRWSSWMVTTKN